MNNRHLTLPLAVAIALASPCALAMGLGPLQVKSGLNQPLVAEIPIISATANELDQLDVRLASPEAFTRVGLERPGELTANLQFSVGKNARGQPVIRVTTPGRFSEPLLSFLIEAEWGKGTVTREYTALIDPPFIAPALIQPMLTPAIAAAPQPVAPVLPSAPSPEPAQTLPATEPEPSEVVATPEPLPAPVAVAPSPMPAPVAPEPQPAPPPFRPQAAAPPPAPAPAPIPVPVPVPSPEPVAAVPEPAPAPAPAAADKYGPIRPGQTLSAIAADLRPAPGISINQMMVALLRANPEAFDEDNVNRLKRGSVLRVPDQDEATRLSAAEAAALVSQQVSAWRSPRQAVPQPAEAAQPEIAAAPAAPKPAAPAAPKPAEPKPAASKPAASAPAIAAVRPTPPASRLEIVPPSGNSRARGAQSGAAAGAGGTELRAELVQTREELAARSSEVTELKSRIGELQTQDADRQRLIEMQNSQLKDLQDRLRQLEAEQAAAKTAAAAAPASAVAAADGGAPAAPTVAGADADTIAKPWYLNPLVLLGAVLAMLAGLVLVMRKSKPKLEAGEPVLNRLSDDEALRLSIARTREAGEPIEPRAGSVPVAEALASTVPAGLPSDPEAAALEAAVQARPQDLERHLSLLRLHHARGNALAYEAAAQQMRLQVATTMDPRWREAVVMGASLMPGHPLFIPAGWNSPRYSEPVAATADGGPVAAAGDRAPRAAAENVRVFDEPVETDLDRARQRDAEPNLDELDLDSHAGVFGETFGELPVDVHRNEAQVMVEDEASATRIELAKAYLDIGDLDGARSMLEEVLADGAPSAKAEAGRLLKDIG